MNHDGQPEQEPPVSRDHSTTSQDQTSGQLENLLEQDLQHLDVEHALLLGMWHADQTPAPTIVPAVAAASAAPATLGAAADGCVDTVTVLHSARALTVGDLRSALVGLPDDQPVAIDVSLDPGGLELHRHVLSAIGGARLLLADEDEVLDPSLVLRGEFPTGLYDIPK